MVLDEGSDRNGVQDAVLDSSTILIFMELRIVTRKEVTIIRCKAFE
jgi:hypothetical protein